LLCSPTRRLSGVSTAGLLAGFANMSGAVVARSTITLGRMKNSGKFQGLDVAWIAINAIGQVAIFTTGGEGPIPDTAAVSVENAEEEVAALPEIGDYALLVDVPRPDDYVSFAKRGLFAYDWCDVHRTAGEATGCYELQARPSRPLILSELPSSLKTAASATRIFDLSFGSSLVVA
jgi:hypothetical protein